MTCCPSPDCDCRELHIDAFEVDDRFDKITVRGEEIVVLHRVEPGGPPPPARHARALLDLETGRVQDDQADPARAREPELIERLQGMVDADTLEELRADYRRFKDRARERAAAAASQAATWRERDCLFPCIFASLDYTGRVKRLRSDFLGSSMLKPAPGNLTCAVRVFALTGRIPAGCASWSWVPAGWWRVGLTV